MRLGAAAVLSAGAFGVAASSAGATSITPPFSNITASSGTAYGTSVNLTVANFLTQLLSLPPLTLTTSPFPIVSGPPFGTNGLSYSTVGANVPTNILNLGVLTGSTNGSTGASGGATSSTKVVGANALNSFLTANVITSSCSVTPTSYTGSSSIADLLIKGQTPGTLYSYPNQNIMVNGVADVILNEQIPTVTSTGVSLTVNAIHIKLNAFTDGPDLLGGDIIIGHSFCSETGTAGHHAP